MLGVGFDNVTVEEAANTAMRLIKERDGAYVVTPNPEIVLSCRKDGELKETVNGASLVLPDGIGIIHGAKLLGTPLKSRVPGIDFINALFRLMAQEGMSAYLFGAKPGVAERAAERLAGEYPGLRIAGTHTGYFEDGGESAAQEIDEKKPDVLLVCLGSPKQENWIREHRSLDVGLLAGLGGSLDVLSGEVQRAPERWQRLGLEWLYRLVKEPWRIKRIAKLAVFLPMVLFSRFRRENDTN